MKKSKVSRRSTEYISRVTVQAEPRYSQGTKKNLSTVLFFFRVTKFVYKIFCKVANINPNRQYNAEIFNNLESAEVFTCKNFVKMYRNFAKCFSMRFIFHDLLI